MKKNFIFALLSLTLSLQAFAAPVKPCTKQKIRYGTVVTYNTLEFCMNQTVTCNNATFGDPIYGTNKQCRDRFNNVVATEGKSFIVK